MIDSFPVINNIANLEMHFGWLYQCYLDSCNITGFCRLGDQVAGS